MKLLVLLGLVGLISAQQQQYWSYGESETYEEATTQPWEWAEATTEQTPAIELPSVSELEAQIKEKKVTADYLNENVEKERIAIVCTCKGNYQDGDEFNINDLLKGSETPKQTCDEICASIRKQSGNERSKRQIGLFGWNAFPNFGFGGLFGGLPVGYGALGFNLLGAWGGLGGANYGCRAMSCGGFGGCHFGCGRRWLPAPMPIVRHVNVPMPVPMPVPQPMPVPVPRRVDVPVIRRVDVPVPRVVNIPRAVPVPVVRRVDVPVVRQINVARPVPVPLPVVKPVHVAVPRAVPVPVQRRLIIKKRLLYRPAVARVSGVALVPVSGVGVQRTGMAGTYGINTNYGGLNIASGLRTTGLIGGGARYYGTGNYYGGIPAPAPAVSGMRVSSSRIVGSYPTRTEGGGYYSSSSSGSNPYGFSKTT